MIKNKDISFSFLLFFIFLVSLLGYVFVYSQKLVNQPIRSDALGYYAYLPAFLIYHDPGMSQIEIYQPKPQVFTYPPIYFNLKTEKYIDKYPLGVALLVLPFFILAQILSFLLVLPLTGYNFVYQHFAGIAGIFYFIAGLYFLAKLYKSYFSKKAVLFALVSLAFATNLFHYATFDSLMSHVFSFFLLSLVLYFFNKVKKFDNKKLIFLGVLIGLIFLVRNLNIILIIPFLLCFGKNRKSLALVLVVAFLICLPQFLYWYYVSGKLLLFSYQKEGFNLLRPNFYGVLFSPRKGLFFWAPIFLLGFLGIGELARKLEKLLPSFLVAIFSYIFLVASWHDWSFGASFGNRAFIDIYPLLGFFLAGFYEKASQRLGYKKIVLLLVFFIILNLTNMVKYWQQILPYDQVSLEIYLKNLFVLKK